MPEPRLSAHFAWIARRYGRVRSLDLRAVRRIARALARHLPGAGGLRLLDVATGTGRYLQALCGELRGRGVAVARAVGADASPAMLSSIAPAVAAPGQEAAVVALAEALPFADASFDAVLSFNAVHHLVLERFFAEATRLLAGRGLLVIYTRTPEQNRATVWGQHFPGFAEREGRLLTAPELRDALAASGAFAPIRLRVAAWWQLTTLPALLRQARTRHYSTFRFYEPEDFERALAAFRARVRRHFGSPWAIPVRNNHTIVFARRRA